MSEQKIRGLTDLQWRKFIDIASELSPENLSCDGESSQTQINKKRKRLLKEWSELEKVAGRQVSEDDAWDYFIQKENEKRKMKAFKKTIEGGC